MNRGTPHERFERKFVPEPASGCWLWIGSLRGDYGVFNMGDRTNVKAHRASWMLYRGAIPDAFHVLHRCDVPACVNPAHLWLGTHQDNMTDRKNKRRGNSPKGESHGGAKLTDDAIRSIRAMKAARLKNSEICARFGIGRSMVKYICARTAWKHVQ